jgi:membrane fusion protein, multidrug efflux system
MKHRLFLMLLFCVSVVTVIGCSSPVEGTVDPGVSTSEPPIFVAPVQASYPKRGDIASYFETTSRVEAQNRVEVLSKGIGISLKVNVEVGDVVKQGQALVELERDELDAQIRQARVAVQQSKTAYEIAERSFNEGIGASAERDNMRFAYEQAKATLDLSELKLRNQTICAPIDGIITLRVIKEGMIVSPGIPLFSIVDPGSYTLPIMVPEKELSRLSVGQEAKANIDAFPDREFTTRVSRINPSIDPLTGTVRILLSFDDADKPLLKDSAFARVKLIMDVRPNVILVPRDAIIEEEGRKYVFLLDAVDPTTVDTERLTGLNGRPLYKARRVDIKTGLEQSDVIEVIEGAPENVLVVTMGQHTLKQDAYATVTNLEEEMTSRSSMSLEEALLAAKKNRDALVSTESGGSSDLGISY